MIERLLIAWHFAATRWGPRARDRAVLLARQERKLRRFRRRLVRKSSYYRGMNPDELPVMTKETFLANFAALNPQGIVLEDASSSALKAERDRDFTAELPAGITVGLSSGTSGRRHVFLVSRADRCRWAGQMLARLLSSASLRQVVNPFAPPLRIAFFLRASSNLYTTLGSRRVSFRYFDLTRPFGELLAELAECDPHVLVAPATVLAEMARREVPVRPGQVISVAEVLDERDRALVERAFSAKVGEVYQAAEGFLGSTCRAGRLHLHEDSLHVEPQWMDDRRERFQPLVTDFSRRSQWFARYHLSDVLVVDGSPCPCGGPTLTLRRIEGRAEEVLWLRGPDGALVPVFPDVLRQALYGVEDSPRLYRIEQHALRWEIRMQGGDREAVGHALEEMAGRLRVGMPVLEFLPWSDQPATEKQKRIRCIAKPS